MKPIVKTLLVLPHLLIVSAPLGFITGIFVTFVTRDVLMGQITFFVVALTYVAWASFAAYSWTTQQEQKAAGV